VSTDDGLRWRTQNCVRFDRVVWTDYKCAYRQQARNSDIWIGLPFQATTVISQVFNSHSHFILNKWPPCRRLALFLSHLIKILLQSQKNRQYGTLSPQNLTYPPTNVQGALVQMVFAAGSLSRNRGHSSTPTSFVTCKPF